MILVNRGIVFDTLHPTRFDTLPRITFETLRIRKQDVSVGCLPPRCIMSDLLGEDLGTGNGYVAQALNRPSHRGFRESGSGHQLAHTGPAEARAVHVKGQRCEHHPVAGPELLQVRHDGVVNLHERISRR